MADTVVWFPTKVSMPKSSSTGTAIAAARDLTNALLHPSPASPLSPISDSQHAALQQLSTIFNAITYPGPAKITTPTTVAKTPTVPPGFEPLPIHVPVALPRVPSYCWTHGHTTNSSHTSALCKKQADGHEVTATKTNTMGSSAHVYSC